MICKLMPLLLKWHEYPVAEVRPILKIVKHHALVQVQVQPCRCSRAGASAEDLFAAVHALYLHRNDGRVCRAAAIHGR